jgi:hypothetical protein
MIKTFIRTLVIFFVVILIWLIIGMKKSDKSYFLPKDALDRASPLNVNIDIEFIKGLKNPAYGK